jgi:hypothetical protein
MHDLDLGELRLRGLSQLGDPTLLLLRERLLLLDPRITVLGSKPFHRQLVGGLERFVFGHGVPPSGRQAPVVSSPHTPAGR